MGPEHDDYEDRDTPPLGIDSPAALLVVFARTAGVVGLSLGAVIALLILAAALASRLLR